MLAENPVLKTAVFTAQGIKNKKNHFIYVYSKKNQFKKWCLFRHVKFELIVRISTFGQLLSDPEISTASFVVIFGADVNEIMKRTSRVPRPLRKWHVMSMCDAWFATYVEKKSLKKHSTIQMLTLYSKN